MLKEKKPVLFILLFAAFILLIFLIMQPLQIRYGGELISVLFPKGLIAYKQRNLLFIIQALMLLVVIPVYILTFIFSWKYRADNTKAKYTPDWDDDRTAEFIWWGVPCFLVLIIGVLTWVNTHELDPYKPIPSDQKSLKIQAVALQWKWLFIYPEEKIAAINFMPIPEKVPLDIDITADAPMNSLWIPQLGGQIYAMPGMRTNLHLIAKEAGEFRGSSANLSGDGFAGMHFIAKASTEEDFKKWIEEAKQSGKILNFDEYTKLVKPSENDPVSIYRLDDDTLFDQIIMKFMHPPKKVE